MGNNVGLNEYTLAVITTDKNMSPVGGCPYFMQMMIKTCKIRHY